MKKIITLLFILSYAFITNAQSFTRSELSTQLQIPWEILWGPDNFLWVTDSGGRVSRINPDNGDRLVVYTAPDYFNGSPLEQLQLCFQPDIGAGTLGLALHPDFLNSTTSYIYFVYSYNSGTPVAPATRFKIKRLLWDAGINSVVNDTDIVTNISTGYDHLGGRLLAIKRNNIPYLFLSVGDHGVSETNSPTCYNPQSTNPNNFAQSPLTDNGKIHRYNMDGSIPVNNPISGNSFYTRGHRNPQGLMYNPNLDILYDIEHGDRTDDEINTLFAGMNYGWKYVRGYHGDNNFPGEATFIANYIPNPLIANDSLVEAFYSWCATIPDTSSNFLDWCTVAPSGGEYYGSTGIPQWTNSLLVVTLKDGLSTDWELFQFKLQPNGQLEPSLPGDPNPKKFFGADQALNGRLRDLATSADGKRIFLINNYGTLTDKITVYSYDSTTSVSEIITENDILIYANPSGNIVYVESPEAITDVKAYNVTGAEALNYRSANVTQINIVTLPPGVYIFKFITFKGREVVKRFVKE